MTLLARTYDIVADRTVMVELDLKKPRRAIVRPDLPVDDDALVFGGFNRDGSARLRDAALARRMEREMLAMFKAACRGQMNPTE